MGLVYYSVWERIQTYIVKERVSALEDWHSRSNHFLNDILTTPENFVFSDDEAFSRMDFITEKSI